MSQLDETLEEKDKGRRTYHTGSVASHERPSEGMMERKEKEKER
jgi:hypothetical protein